MLLYIYLENISNYQPVVLFSPPKLGREDEGEIDGACLLQSIPVSLARQKGTSTFTGPSPNPTGECHFYRSLTLKPKCTKDGAVRVNYIFSFFHLSSWCKSTAERPCWGYECSQQAYLHWHPSHSRGTPSFFVRTLASGSARGEQRTFYSYIATRYTSLAIMRSLD